MGEVCSFPGETISRSVSPIDSNKPHDIKRRKSFFGSLFGPDLGPADNSFVHSAAEVALDFLYPMRRIDRRYAIL